jgi:hypothetical protein
MGCRQTGSNPPDRAWKVGLSSCGIARFPVSGKAVSQAVGASYTRSRQHTVTDRKQRNQSNRVNYSISTDGPSERVVEFRAAIKQKQRFVEYRQAVTDCHLAVSQSAWSRRESTLTQLLAVVRTKYPDVADALRVGSSTWSTANCNRLLW